MYAQALLVYIALESDDRQETHALRGELFRINMVLHKLKHSDTPWHTLSYQNKINKQKHNLWKKKTKKKTSSAQPNL